MFIDELVFDKKNVLKEISDYSKNGGKIYIWGTGSVAVGVSRSLEKLGIAPTGFFNNVPNPNVDERISAKANILSFDELKKSNGRYSVIVGHSHVEIAETVRDEFVDNIWCMPHAVREDAMIDETFVRENIEALEECYSLLEDDYSKRAMVSYFNSVLTGDVNFITEVFNGPCTYFSNDLIKINPTDIYLDCGAYHGEIIDEFIDASNGEYGKIVAIEVFPKSYEFLKNKYSNENKIEILCKGISDHDGTDMFSLDEQSTCLNSKNAEEIDCAKIDTICKDFVPNYIKLCVGGDTTTILRGASELIKNETPNILISMGVGKNSFCDCVSYLHKASGGKYKFNLRYTHALSECIILFAIRK